MCTSFQSGATSPTNGARIEPSENPTDDERSGSVGSRPAAARPSRCGWRSHGTGSAGRSRVGARVAPFLAVSLAGLTAGTRPAAAQSANRELIDGLAAQLLLIALPLTALVLGGLAYGAVRRRNEAPRPATERPLLEVAWTVGTALVLVVAGVAAYPVLTTPYLSPGPAEGAGDSTSIDGANGGTEIEVVAAQWEWRFEYDEANVTTRGELVLPADEDVRLVATSRDVIHALAIPALGVKRTVYPGRETVMLTAVDEPGEYRAHCTEFCGTGHATMRANVTVVDRETYDEWLAAHEGMDDVTDPPDSGG